MNFQDFSSELKEKSSKIGIDLCDEEIENFYKYKDLLLEWNEKINLTAITDEKEVILKHFVDSLTIRKYIKDGDLVADVGTGAGFPGIPLAIISKNTNYLLLDSLNKRINFLNDVKEKINLDNIETLHSRVEDFGQNKKYRECFDVATSRAVAPLNVLLEYLMPLIKIGGQCICMKGSNKEEIEEARNAIKILGGEIEIIENLFLPDSDMERNIIIVKKVKNTNSKYPRKAGIPSKEPIK